MAVGLISCTNSELLTKIRENHPDGIYKKEDFLARVMPGTKFFTIDSGEWVGASMGDCLTFVSVVDDSKIRCKEGSSKAKERFVDDFFWKPKCVFLSEEAAQKYVDELNMNKDSLWGTI
jgi:hypothetical protein